MLHRRMFASLDSRNRSRIIYRDVRDENHGKACLRELLATRNPEEPSHGFECRGWDSGSIPSEARLGLGRWRGPVIQNYWIRLMLMFLRWF